MSGTQVSIGAGMLADMFLRSGVESMSMTAGPSSPLIDVPFEGFASVSGVRWVPETEELLATAVPAGAQQPDLSINDRGDFRLYRFRVASREWSCVYPGYAHDPVFSPAFGYAVHSGRGVVVIDDTGHVRRDVRVGRFNWGWPALSVSPDGDRIVWCRWKGDDPKPQVLGTDGELLELRSTVSRYAWYDNDTWLFHRGMGLRLLDLTTGKESPFGKSLRAGLVDSPSLPDEHRDLMLLRPSQVHEFFGQILVKGEEIWVEMSVCEQAPMARARRFDGIVRCDRQVRQPEVLVHHGRNERCGGFDTVGGSIVYRVHTLQDLRIVDGRTEYRGPLVPFLSEGWFPAITSATPSFHSHAPLDTLRPQ